jgi:hypothetical protein
MSSQNNVSNHLYYDDDVDDDVDDDDDDIVATLQPSAPHERAADGVSITWSLLCLYLPRKVNGMNADVYT